MNNQHNDEYNRAAGSNHKTSEEKPVLESASPTALVMVTLISILALLGLGLGILIVMAP